MNENGELESMCITYFQNLIEHCCSEIFSSNALDLMDLCSVAETCTRFHSIANDITKNGLSVKIIGQSCYKFNTKHHTHKTYRRDDLKRIFKNFGSSLREISISSFDRQEDFLLNLVADSCVEYLERLSIDFLTIPEAVAVKLRPNFKQLQSLALVDVHLEAANPSLFDECPLLVSLVVNSVRNCGAILENTFPKLERFEYQKYCLVLSERINDPSSQQNFATLSTFISRHAMLTKLHLRFVHSFEGSTVALMKIIGTNCNEMVELRLLTNINGLNRAPRRYCGEMNVLQPLTALRELCLCHVDIPIYPNQFAALTQLKKLVLRDCSSTDVDVVVGIVRHLVNLEEFVISLLRYKSTRFFFKLTEKSFMKIVDIVQFRPNVLTLKCKINFTLDIKDEKIRLLPIASR